MRELNKIENTSEQIDQVNVYLDALGQTTDRWPSQSSVEMKKMECVE
jgi:hypothetical protein